MIYFAQDAGVLNIKIGYSVNAESRVNGLQTGCPSMLSILHIMPGERDLEASLHSRFASHRIHGEWFRPAPAILEFILQDKAKEAANKIAKPLFAKTPWPLKIYLAGKISDNRWRREIVNCDLLCSENCDDELPEWTPLKQAIFGTHTYVGPFFTSSQGHRIIDDDEDDHGVGASNSLLIREQITRKCLAAINSADIVFAWIDSIDCYGTIAEIGYARAARIPVYAAGPKIFRDLWFTYQICNNSDRYPLYVTPIDALTEIIAAAEVRYKTGY